MAKYTKSEFAEQCGVTSNYISVYLAPSNGGLILGEDGLIDTENLVNAHFLNKRIKKLNKQQSKQNLNASPQYIPKSVDGDDDDDIPTYEESERRVKYFDAIKREKEVEKLQIEIDKKRGEVIPSELISPFFLLHSQSLTTEFKNAMEDSLRNICHLYSVSITDVADFKGYITNRINESLNKATDGTVRQMKQLVQEYADKRGIGERL